MRYSLQVQILAQVFLILLNVESSVSCQYKETPSTDRTPSQVTNCRKGRGLPHKRRSSMSNRQKESNIHTVKIQQTYWVKDTSEEKMLALGAVWFGRVVEQVDYYDTDLYDLAATEMWLSKMGQEWKLIVGKSTQNSSKEPPKAKVERRHLKTSENQKNDSITDQNGNADHHENKRKALTCYALGQENEIIAFLAEVLHVPKETNMVMEAFLQVSGIQRYATIKNVTQEMFRLPDNYTILLKTEGTTTKKTAVVSLDVDIENVTQGFQRLEQLANELDLHLQSV